MSGIFKNFKPFDRPKKPEDFRIPGFDTEGDPKKTNLGDYADAQGNIVKADPLDKPLPMPVRDDDAMRNAKRKSMAEQRRRRGRASTILTALNDSEGLGG